MRIALVTKVLSAFGILNEQMSVEEVIMIYCEGLSGQIELTYKVGEQTILLGPYTENQLKAVLQQEEVIKQLKSADNICLKISCEEGVNEIEGGDICRLHWFTTMPVFKGVGK